MRFAPDDTIGNYRVERELGSTATTTLYQVVHVVLPRRAVLKVTAQPAFAVPFLREACIVEALRHPGVPQVHESGLLADRRPWFAVEAIDGYTLVERIVQGPLDALETTLLVRDIATVLEHAHRRGIVHRGLRPDRVVLTPRRRFALCIPDWSNARAHDAAPAIPHVPTAETRHYLAPEAARGDTVDDRADVYALGVIALSALTGRHPEPGDAAVDAPPALARLVDQMRAPDRYDRPSSAEVRAELDGLAAALVDAVPVTPIEDIELVDTDGVPATATLPRIRRPRWTPPYATVTADEPTVDEPDVTRA